MQQDITYTSFEQPNTICENGNTLTFKYGIDKQRIKTILTDATGNTIYERTFVGDYEEETTAAGTKKIHYISSPTGLVAVYIEANGTGTMYYVLKDHLGSITGLVDDNGNMVQQYSYDAWGKRSLTTDNTSTGNYLLYRGYTGHEHLDEFALINMNGRMYDPVIGRMLSPDNYVQGGSNGFNRYAYVHNNPLKYTDPSGNIPLLAVFIIGGSIYSMIRNEQRPISGPGDMATTFAIGGTSAVAGYGVGTSGVPFANTLGIMAGSATNSIGEKIASGGESDFTVSFGAASYNFDKNELGYLGKPGNSTLQNIGYGFGALANIRDLVALNSGTDIIVKARQKLFGHSQAEGSFNNHEIKISVGPADCEDVSFKNNQPNGIQFEWPYVKRSLQLDPVLGENESYIQPKDLQVNTTLTNVNGKLLYRMTQNLNSRMNLLNTSTLRYGLLQGCVNYTSRALLFSGVLNVNAFLPITSPLLLNLELGIQQYSFITCYMAQNKY